MREVKGSDYVLGLVGAVDDPAEAPTVIVDPDGDRPAVAAGQMGEAVVPAVRQEHDAIRRTSTVGHVRAPGQAVGEG